MAIINPPSENFLSALRDRLSYDQESGEIRWRNPTSSRLKTGDLAGAVVKGYISLHIVVDGEKRKIAGHHIAWFLTHGYWPDRMIDHRNGDGTDNRLSNLREANDGQNSKNHGIRFDSPFGVTGVNRRRGRYVADIFCDGVRHDLGSFATLEEATQARSEAETTFFGEYARNESEKKRRGAQLKCERKTRSGIRGVFHDSHNKGMWCAELQVGKKRYRLGRFATKKGAIAARLEAEELYLAPGIGTGESQ